MTVRAALVAIAAAGLVAGTGQAQSRADEARIDDFALPASRAASSDVGVEQLTTTRDGAAAPAANSRSPELPQPQIAKPGERGALVQVGGDQQRSAAAAPSLSAVADGKPTASGPLGGTDLCDPQAPGAQTTPGCKRIIEQRAAEFAQARPSLVSAEAALLTLANAPERTADAATGRMARSADAEERASQELAAITLATAPPVATPEVPSAQADTLGATLAEIIVQIVTGGP